MNPDPVTNELIAEIRETFDALLPWVEYPRVSDLLARHAADTERIKALDSEIGRLREALRFYAGKLRADKNGYEFEKESFTGEVARAALQPQQQETSKSAATTSVVSRSVASAQSRSGHSLGSSFSRSARKRSGRSNFRTASTNRSNRRGSYEWRRRADGLRHAENQQPP